MKRIALIPFLILVISITACSGKTNNVQPSMDEVAHEFHDLVEKTAMSENKTVVWNGTTAMMADCDFDDGTIEDKHYPPTQLFIETERWDLVTDAIGEVVAENTSSEITKYIGDTCMIEVLIPDSYETAVSELIELPDHLNIDSSPIVMDTEKKYSEMTCYRGLIETDNNTMAGYTTVLKTVWGTPFVLRYYGIGDMADVDYYFGSMIGSFHEKKDVDELKEELGI